MLRIKYLKKSEIHEETLHLNILSISHTSKVKSKGRERQNAYHYLHQRKRNENRPFVNLVFNEYRLFHTIPVSVSLIFLALCDPITTTYK